MISSTRERIITEALRLFSEKGFAATPISLIESAAVLSPGSGALYRHFRSKEDLYVHTNAEMIAAWLLRPR